ncbi:hypothetical protein T440DRAFT_457060, partial [Plenodomus tracheiphilus IPT5]
VLSSRSSLPINSLLLRIPCITRTPPPPSPSHAHAHSATTPSPPPCTPEREHNYAAHPPACCSPLVVPHPRPGSHLTVVIRARHRQRLSCCCDAEHGTPLRAPFIRPLLHAPRIPTTTNPFAIRPDSSPLAAAPNPHRRHL